jgi:hypothetical protein
MNDGTRWAAAALFKTAYLNGDNPKEQQMNNERRKIMKPRYLVPFTGKRKTDRIKTVLGLAVLAFMAGAAFFISSCDTPMNNTIILPAVAGSGGTPGTPVTTPTPGAVLYDITVAPGITNGTITPDKVGSQAAAEGEAIVLSIAPDSLHRLKSGSLKYNDGTGHAISGDFFIMPASEVSVTGAFELIPVDAALYDITVDPGITNGTITPDKVGSQAAAEGEAIVLSIAPAGSYRLKSGTLKYNDGTDHAISGDRFIMPASDVTVTGEFELIPVNGGVPPAASVSLNTHLNNRMNDHDGDLWNTMQLTATVLPVEALQEVVWTTSDKNGVGASVQLIVIDPLTVTVKGTRGGELYVHATAADGSGKTDACELWIAH